MAPNTRLKHKEFVLSEAAGSGAHENEEAKWRNSQEEEEVTGSKCLDVGGGDGVQGSIFRTKIAWRSTFLISGIHLIAFYGFYLWYCGFVTVKVFSIGLAFGVISALGTTAGAHRYWAHRSFKAKLPLQIFLAFCQTISCQNSIYEWCRDHRVHHKFSETDADPHNIKRGFFFAHMGWLLLRKHPDVKAKGKCVDLSDLENDPIVSFQRKYYIPLILSCSFFLPTWVMWVWMGGQLSFSYSFIATIVRYVLSLHFTWLVNSAAHYWGPRPYDRGIHPAENVWVSILSFGEGWHNYHHVYPWDYKTSELGLYRFNFTALFIDTCSLLGLAYERRSVSTKIIEARMKRTGDGTTYKH